MLSNQTKDIDSGEARFLNVLLENVCSSLAGKEWRQATLVMFVTPDRSVNCISRYMLELSFDVLALNFSFNTHKEVSDSILGLYDLALQNKGDEWNKMAIRFIRQPDKLVRIAEYKRYFDSDYQWLVSLEPESFEYLCVDIEDEIKIQSWEGLSTDHPRPWVQAKKMFLN